MRSVVDVKAADAWDAEYAAGRYDGEPPVAFVNDVIVAARNLTAWMNTNRRYRSSQSAPLTRA
ncbi:MAG: hypothetical protein ACRDYX_21185 [Egibacteraceae bacterium]